MGGPHHRVVRRRPVHYEKAPAILDQASRTFLEIMLMPTSLINSSVFRDIFTTEAMRRVFSDENRVQKYLDFEAGLGAGAGAARHHPQRGRRGNLQALPCRRDRLRQAEDPDREDRLSGAAGGAAARGAVPRRARRMVPLGRDHAGHHRQRHGDADPRSAHPDRRQPDAHLRRAGYPRQEISRHAHGRPQQSAAGGADHVRLQDGDDAGRVRAPPAAPEGVAPARVWSANSAAPPERCPR